MQCFGDCRTCERLESESPPVRDNWHHLETDSVRPSWFRLVQTMRGINGLNERDKDGPDVEVPQH